MIHEKLFHAFVISQDLEYFLHDHPTLGLDGAFHYNIAFPKAGIYRVLGDFFPDGATPQLITKTIIVPGAPPVPVELTRDYAPKQGENVRVELVTVPEDPVAGQKTEMRFRLDPIEGFEKYLGAWGHMLAASNDLIDIQFNMVFPRPQTYRVWVQFQRNGVVNTVYFDIPVKALAL
jgi:hypothetical protein